MTCRLAFTLSDSPSRSNNPPSILSTAKALPLNCFYRLLTGRADRPLFRPARRSRERDPSIASQRPLGGWQADPLQRLSVIPYPGPTPASNGPGRSLGQSEVAKSALAASPPSLSPGLSIATPPAIHLPAIFPNGFPIPHEGCSLGSSEFFRLASSLALCFPKTDA